MQYCQENCSPSPFWSNSWPLENLNFCQKIRLWFIKANFGTFLCQRPYHAEYTSSRPITEVKQRRAQSVLGWVTAWEHWVLLAFLFSLFSFEWFELVPFPNDRWQRCWVLHRLCLVGGCSWTKNLDSPSKIWTEMFQMPRHFSKQGPF